MEEEGWTLPKEYTLDHIEIDPTSLVRVIENNLWNKDLIDKVMKYGRLEESPSVRIFELKDEER